MKMKSFKLLALVAILMPMLFSCSGGKSESENASSEEVEVVSTPAELDVERIMSYKSKDGSALTEKDYDFLLDQMEILVNKATELPADQAKNFIKTLDKDQQDAAFVVGVILASSDQSTWTDKQKKHFQELAERDPSKK